MVWIDFVICLLFGILGVHKFREKRIGLGVLYLLTGGLFGFGWIVDCVRYLLTAISSAKSGKMEKDNEVTPGVQLVRGKWRTILFWVITVILGLIGFAYFPNLAGILALVAALLIAPIEKWKQFLGKYISENMKNAIAIVLAVLVFIVVPGANGNGEELDNPEPVVTTTITTAPEKETSGESEIKESTEAINSETTVPETETTGESGIKESTEATNAETTTATEQNSVAESEPKQTDAVPVQTTEAEKPGQDYVLNTSSKKFHYPSCSSVKDMKEYNKKDYHGTREELIERGYDPWGRCKP